MAELKEPAFQMVGIRPTTAAAVQTTPRRKRLHRLPVGSAAVLLLIGLGCLFAPLLANHDPSGFYLDHLNEPPSREFFFGTDSMGRDLFSMLWYGGRASLTVGLLSAALTAVLGIGYGCISGLASDTVDAVMMRVMEAAHSVPTLLYLLLLGAMLPKQNTYTLALLIGGTGWFALARLVRNEVRQIRTCEYVLAARCMGMGRWWMIRTHLLPNILPSILFALISSVGSSISMEATLSFLGLGLPVEVVSWGSMLSLANRALLLNTWWVIVFPGVFLLATLGGITGVGNYFRAEGNPACSNL